MSADHPYGKFPYTTIPNISQHGQPNIPELKKAGYALAEFRIPEDQRRYRPNDELIMYAPGRKVELYKGKSKSGDDAAYKREVDTAWRAAQYHYLQQVGAIPTLMQSEYDLLAKLESAIVDFGRLPDQEGDPIRSEFEALIHNAMRHVRVRPEIRQKRYALWKRTGFEPEEPETSPPIQSKFSQDKQEGKQDHGKNIRANQSRTGTGRGRAKSRSGG